LGDLTSMRSRGFITLDKCKGGKGKTQANSSMSMRKHSVKGIKLNTQNQSNY